MLEITDLVAIGSMSKSFI